MYTFLKSFYFVTAVSSARLHWKFCMRVCASGKVRLTRRIWRPGLQAACWSTYCSCAITRLWRTPRDWTSTSHSHRR